MATDLLITNIYKAILLVLFVYEVVYERSLLRTALCEPGTSNASSKRVVVIVSLFALVHLCYKAVDACKTLDPNIIVAFTVLILTAATIATLPQLAGILGNVLALIKGGKQLVEDKTDDKPVIIQQQNNFQPVDTSAQNV